MKICSNCGKTMSNNERICSSCGRSYEEASVNNVVVCHNCGKSFSAENAFCVHCGATVIPTIARSKHVPVKSPEKAKKNTGLIITLSVLVVILLGVIAFLLIKFGFGKDDAVTTNTETQEETAVEEKEQPEEVPAVEEYKVICTVVNCAESITLRESASITSGEITSISLGEEVQFIEESVNGFYKVKYRDTYGYCLSSFLEFEDGEDITDEYTETMQVVNCEESITLRSIPSTTGEEFAQIPLGATVTYICNAENGFCCVRYNGQIGFALQQYLSF